MIADATVIRIDKAAYDMTIDGSGKVYPGFIAPNTLGLVEIDAIKSSDDENEIGQMNQMLGYYSFQCRIKSY
jgi:hypothetical protein